MYILVTYDVQTESITGQKRLREVAKICQNYGQRVQNSVFECILSDVQLANMKARLEQVIDTSSDSIRIYFLKNNKTRRIIVIGHDHSFNIEDTLII